jgi:hypothetical protein
MRLILHTGAYWLLLDLHAAIPSWNPLRHTEFATVRLRLLKIARRPARNALAAKVCQFCGYRFDTPLAAVGGPSRPLLTPLPLMRNRDLISAVD